MGIASRASHERTVESGMPRSPEMQASDGQRESTSVALVGLRRQVVDMRRSCVAQYAYVTVPSSELGAEVNK